LERWGEAELARNPQWWAFLPDGCHPNAVGHALVAEALAERVADALPEPPR
jgi:lysophospholipase L1-like esterase